MLLACCAGVAGGGPAAVAAGTVAVYGLELEVDAERERLLIFADAPLEPRLILVDDRTLMVALPGTALDPSAPTHLTPVVQGTVVRVTAFDRAEASGPPEVRVVIQRRPGAPPRIEQRASIVALDFEPLPRAAAPARDDTISVSYRNVPIAQVVADLARATGEAIVFDDAVSALGALTIEGPPRVSRAEALALIDSVLLLRGFAAIPAPGGGRKVVPLSGAPSPWAPDGKLADSDAPVTTLLRLSTTKAADLLPVLTPYLGQVATATVFEPTNSLILSGPASLLRQLRIAVEALDQLDAGRPLIWPLRYGNADVIAEQVLEILGERDVPVASSDARTNALLLRVRPGEVERVRALVDRLDRPARGRGELHVVKLRYADPEQLAQQLQALRDDAGAGDASDPAARRGGLRGLSFDAVADAPTNSLVLRAPPETFDAIFDVVSELDRQPTSVRVEITIASYDLDDSLDLGIDYLIPTLTNPKAPDDLIAAVVSNSSGGGIQTLPSADRPFVAAFTRAPLLLTITDPDTGQQFAVQIPRESGSITMNGREVRADVLLRPQLLLTTGEEHEIFAGDNVPIPVASTPVAQTGAAAPGSAPAETGSPLQVQQNIERQDVGTSLRVTPTIGAQGGVILELGVEVSSLRASEAGTVEEVGPTIRQIRVESVIRLRHGEIAVIATAEQPFSEQVVTGVPWLKDIPWLGFAFRTTSEQKRKSQLLIAAQAEILRPETRELAERLARELGPLEPAASQARQAEPSKQDKTRD